MSLARLLNQPITIQSVGGTATDEYGNTVPGAVGAPVNVLGYLDQKDTIEYLDGRQTVVSKWKAFLPATATVDGYAVVFLDTFGMPGALVLRPMDYIIYEAQQFQVDGEPHYVYNPRTKTVSHVECKLIEVS